MDLGDFQLAMFTDEKVRQYLIYTLPTTILRSFGVGEDRHSWCGDGVECHRVKVEATATTSSPTPAWRYYTIELG